RDRGWEERHPDVVAELENEPSARFHVTETGIGLIASGAAAVFMGAAGAGPPGWCVYCGAASATVGGIAIVCDCSRRCRQQRFYQPKQGCTPLVVTSRLAMLYTMLTAGPLLGTNKTSEVTLWRHDLYEIITSARLRFHFLPAASRQKNSTSYVILPRLLVLLGLDVKLDDGMFRASRFQGR
ncbi:unnamed protein product, partial [Amoebophrya sp. A120]